MIEKADVGLCARCRHAETVVSSRGSRFYLCRVSLVDPRFPKYPALPAIACERHEPQPAHEDRRTREREKLP